MLRRARKLVSPAPVIKITFRAYARPQGENRVRAERRAGRGRLRSAQDAARGAAGGSRPHRHETRVRIGRMRDVRSEEHTSELQSRLHLVCRLLLEKKKQNKT